jgi:hypothetical protein
VRVKAPAKLSRVRHGRVRPRCGRLEVRIDRAVRLLASEQPLVLVAPEVRKHLLEDMAVRQRQRELVVTQHAGHPRIIHSKLARLADKLVDAVRLGVPGRVQQI